MNDVYFVFDIRITCKTTDIVYIMNSNNIVDNLFIKAFTKFS